MRIAVASSSVRERLDRTLARAGLEFEVTIAGDEVEHGKPAPDMFLWRRAAGRCRRRCVVVEDSGPGVAAGLAAGMPTLGVCRVPGTEATLAQADRIVHDVTADAILELLLKRQPTMTFGPRLPVSAMLAPRSLQSLDC